jgi:hypothetical protein
MPIWLQHRSRAPAGSGGSLAASAWRMRSMRWAKPRQLELTWRKAFRVVPGSWEASRVWLGQFLGLPFVIGR